MSFPGSWQSAFNSQSRTFLSFQLRNNLHVAGQDRPSICVHPSSWCLLSEYRQALFFWVRLLAKPGANKAAGAWSSGPDLEAPSCSGCGTQLAGDTNVRASAPGPRPWPPTPHPGGSREEPGWRLGLKSLRSAGGGNPELAVYHCLLLHISGGCVPLPPLSLAPHPSSLGSGQEAVSWVEKAVGGVAGQPTTRLLLLVCLV